MANEVSRSAGEELPAAEPRWLNRRESLAWRGYLTMADLLHSQVASDLLADSGLSSADYQVLVNLSESEGHRLRMTELASRLDWSKSRVSHQFARMESRGLVGREECPSDARGAFAVLTDAGMDEIRRAAPGHVESVRRHFIDVLEPEEIDELIVITTKVLEHLRTQPVGSKLPAGECPNAAAASEESAPACGIEGSGEQAEDGHAGAER
jgi:DNA-binding MarR family transcriptional regulator